MSCRGIHETIIRSRNVRARISKGQLRTRIQLRGHPFVMQAVETPALNYKEIVWCRACQAVLSSVKQQAS